MPIVLIRDLTQYILICRSSYRSVLSIERHEIFPARPIAGTPREKAIAWVGLRHRPFRMEEEVISGKLVLTLDVMIVVLSFLLGQVDD